MRTLHDADEIGHYQTPLGYVRFARIVRVVVHQRQHHVDHTEQKQAIVDVEKLLEPET